MRLVYSYRRFKTASCLRLQGVAVEKETVRPKDRGSTLAQNVGKCIQIATAYYSRRLRYLRGSVSNKPSILSPTQVFDLKTATCFGLNNPSSGFKYNVLK